MLYGLALTKLAPPGFGRLSRSRVPATALFFSCCCIAPGIILLYAAGSIMEAFTYATTVASVLFVFVWGLIIISYLVYLRRVPERHARSTYKMPGNKIMCWAVLAFFGGMLVILALDRDTLIAMALTPIWFVLLAVIYHATRRHPVPPVASDPDVAIAPLDAVGTALLTEPEDHALRLDQPLGVGQGHDRTTV
jgi:D-serine/D-alanine/glycine transporter